MSKLPLGLAVMAVGTAVVLAACGSGNGDPVIEGDGGLVDGDNPFAETGTGGCVAKTCAEIGAECGQQGNGCGQVIDCGSCQTGFCGGGGPSKCGDGIGDGGAPVHARCCADLSAGCGPQGDGCGGVMQCGNCAAPKFCGGAGPTMRHRAPRWRRWRRRRAVQADYVCSPRKELRPRGRWLWGAAAVWHVPRRPSVRSTDAQRLSRHTVRRRHRLHAENVRVLRRDMRSIGQRAAASRLPVARARRRNSAAAAASASAVRATQASSTRGARVSVRK